MLDILGDVILSKLNPNIMGLITLVCFIMIFVSFFAIESEIAGWISVGAFILSFVILSKIPE